MSLLNDHVRMGESLATVNPIRRLRGLTNVGRIYMGAGIQPAGIQPATPPVQPVEIAAILGGGGALVGSAYVDGPASALLAILGALGIGYAGYQIFSRMSTPAPAPRPTAMLPVKTQPYGVPAAQYAQALVPVLTPTIKSLFSPAPAPVAKGGIAPASTVPSSAFVTQADLNAPSPSSPQAVAPANPYGMVTSLDTSSSGSPAPAPTADGGFVTSLEDNVA